MISKYHFQELTFSALSVFKALTLSPCCVNFSYSSIGPFPLSPWQSVMFFSLAETQDQNNEINSKPTFFIHTKYVLDTIYKVNTEQRYQAYTVNAYTALQHCHMWTREPDWLISVSCWSLSLSDRCCCKCVPNYTPKQCKPVTVK